MTYERPYADGKKSRNDVRVYDMDVIVEKNLALRRKQEELKKEQQRRAKAMAEAKKQKANAQVKSKQLKRNDTTLESYKNNKVVSAVKTPKVRTIKSNKSVPFPTSAVFVSVICTVLFMFMMLTLAQINEFTRDISTLQGKLSELVKQEEELSLDIELKNDLRKVENAAVNELGMVKGDEVAKQYIVIGNEDKIEVIEPEPKEDDGLINTVMSAIGENFRDLVEYIN